jgi:hypothetical protein
MKSNLGILRYLILNGFVLVIVIEIPIVYGLSFFQQLQELWRGSTNPCYDRDVTQPSAVDCTDVVIPNNFCEVCGISRAVRPEQNGNYQNCLYTSGVEAINGDVNMQCLQMIDSYVKMNPCDTPRATGLRRYRQRLSLPRFLRRLRSHSRQIMDSFVYAICELACDCIPQYNASINVREVDVYRANCQGHAYYDVCQIYPNIQLVRGETTYSDRNMTNSSLPLPNVCPYIHEWRLDHPGEWFEMTPTTVHPIVQTFLHHILDASQLLTAANDTLWQQCYYVESTQLQIVPM